jgi:hypothetical protein
MPARCAPYGSLAFKPCTLPAPSPRGEPLEAQCTTYEVAEDPARPEGRKVALNIAWLPATNEGAATDDPVFFLAGGPGQSAVQVWPAIDGAFREVRKSRHIVLVDQRGTGKSNPLACKERSQRRLQRSAATSARRRAACLCGLHAPPLSAKADPRFYTTTDAVRRPGQRCARRSAPAKINLVGG